jgi:hypothetical protein
MARRVLIGGVGYRWFGAQLSALRRSRRMATRQIKHLPAVHRTEPGGGVPGLDLDPPEIHAATTRRPGSALPAVAVAGVVAAGVIARFVATSPLWLDEALTVNIARLPIRRLADALRHDGAPPLYYLLLHGWIRWVGSGDVAVRALSGLFAVASMPLMWLAGRRLSATVEN